MGRDQKSLMIQNQIAILVLMISACLIIKKPAPHPMAKQACHDVTKYTGIPTLQADIQPLQWLHNYFVFKVYLGEIILDTDSPRYYYIAVSDSGESFILHQAHDLNRLLATNSVNIDSDTIALSVALLLFDMNNLSGALNKKYIISNADMIPGHSKKLYRKNLKESQSLRHLIKNSFYPNKKGEFLYNSSFARGYKFFMEMIEIYDCIYVDKTVDINDSIHAPNVKHNNDHFTVTFFTWARPFGAVKKWVVNIDKRKYITDYSWNTIFMFIGDFRIGIGYVADHFNYEWQAP